VSNANGVVTVNLGGLANGATATTTIVVTVGSSTVGNITNTATISGVETDPNMANNTATATTLVNAPIHVVTSPQADLAIVKKASSGSAYVGGTLTYTLTITNYGSSADTGVTVTDTLPSGETFLSASSSQGSTTVSNGVVHATLGGMGNQGKATVTIVVRVNAIAGSTVTNTASVTGGVDDPNLTNNQSSISTPVYGLPSKRNFLT
jgi:uncharacterized repeat protein (TIGR01451 family)